MHAVNRIVIGLVAAAFAVNLAFAQSQGISKTEIVIGTIQDLSGPVAAYGKQTRSGLQMRVDEINEKGGINGRKFKLVVEDNGYDPKKALLAAQKLVTNDEVFAILGHIGTAPNMAAMPIQFEKNVINFFPLTGSREMFEPPEKLKMAFSPPYFDQMRIVVPQLIKTKSAKKVCIIHQDDEYGLEVLRGTEAGLKAVGMPLVEKTSFKRGATDFSSQIAKLKAAECDLVVLGTIIRETVGAVGEARKIGFNPTFVGPTAMYTHLIHTLGGKAVEGVYGVHTVAHPYADDPHPPVREWAAKYKAKFGEDATVFSVYGYYMMDIFAKAAEKAGANLTTDTFNNAMESTTFPPDIFGAPECRITKTDRLCNSKVRLAQIKDGRWVSISDYFAAE
jgi:branched-chain amino acid transport system substrate-binding protein